MNNQKLKIAALKDEIISSYNEIFTWSKLRLDIIEAFNKTDRHKFVDSYYEDDNKTIVCFNSEEETNKLSKIYSNYYLPILISEDGEVLSSISQPSLVLYMLNISNIKEGDRVLEIGTASGWNAALMSELVGETGEIDTLEVDESLANSAKNRLQKFKYDNINVYCEDSLGIERKSKYDLIIFTVGAYDIPKEYYSKLTENGTLILVLKSKSNGDSLYALKKSGNSFNAEDGIPCGFVQLKGQFSYKNQNQSEIDERIKSLFYEKDNEIVKYWFGGNKVGDFDKRSYSFMSYLSLYDSYFVSLNIKNILTFDSYNEQEHSIALFQNGILCTSKNKWANERLQKALNYWTKIGMPIPSSFSLEIRMKSKKRNKKRDEIVVVGDENYFYYSLENRNI